MLDVLGNPLDYMTFKELKDQGTGSDFTRTEAYKMLVGPNKVVQQVKVLDSKADDLSR